MEDNLNKEKKDRSSIFFMRNPYMKFQNISRHGSKVMLCTRKRYERTNERTDKPEAIYPHFFKVGSIINRQTD